MFCLAVVYGRRHVYNNTCSKTTEILPGVEFRLGSRLGPCKQTIQPKEHKKKTKKKTKKNKNKNKSCILNFTLNGNINFNRIMENHMVRVLTAPLRENSQCEKQLFQSR